MKKPIEIESLSDLRNLLEKIGTEKIFLMTGRKSFDDSIFSEKVLSACSEYSLTRFNKCLPNPTVEGLAEGVNEFKQSSSNVILAVGGGSVLDLAKSIKYVTETQVSLDRLFEKELEVSKNGRVILISLPTTSGTGSEVTQFATLYKDKIKKSLDHEILLSDYYFLDPLLTLELPQKITAETGMDALAQSIESYWSVRSCSTSKEIALEALKIIINNLEKAVLNPSIESRRNMAIGSNLAGKAINMTRTTAAHALSYPLSSHYGVPHGQAVALFLPYVFSINLRMDANVAKDVEREELKETMETLASVLGVKAGLAEDYLRKLMERIGLKTSFKDLGLPVKASEYVMLEGFNPDRMKNNPVEIDKACLKEILNSLSEGAV